MSDIAIKDDDWNQLSSDEQTQIQNFVPNDNITPSSDGAAALDSAPSASASDDGQNAACLAACSAALQAAKRVCLRLKKPIAIGVCYAVADVVYRVCCSKCGGQSQSNLTDGGDTTQSGGDTTQSGGDTSRDDTGGGATDAGSSSGGDA
jgi:hypothetical protein